MQGPDRRIRLTAGLAVALAACLAVTSFGTSCSPSRPPDPLEAGREVFERSVGGLACADCHGESAAPRENPDWRPAGHPLAGVAKRGDLWRGRFEGDGRLLDASMYCAARFQYRITEGLGPTEELDLAKVPVAGDQREHLLAYLRTFEGDGASPEFPRDVDVYEVFDLAGDPERGETVWRAACAVCHGYEARGDLGPGIVGADSVDEFKFAEYVRKGGYDGVGWMPWFPPDRLSDQDLADLVARWVE